jgi:putative hydrolase of the HAD superfamily
MSLDLICLDADDTLWHNMRFFNEAFAEFGAMFSDVAAPDLVTRALNDVEARHRSLYGFGAKGLTLSMVETAMHFFDGTVPGPLLARILEMGRYLLSHPVELLDDVSETIEQIAAWGPLVLVTKGDLLHQESKLAASGLGALFTGVEIVSDKSVGTYRHVFTKYRAQPARCLMVGDSMRSDILPALEAGAWAAYIPQPGAWELERADPPRSRTRYRQVDRLADIPALIEDIHRLH